MQSVQTDIWSARSYSTKMVSITDGEATYTQPATGECFGQPVLSETGIQISTYLYRFVSEERVDAHNEEVKLGRTAGSLLLKSTYAEVVPAETYFQVPPHSPVMWEFKHSGKWTEIPASLANLKLLINLPLLSDETYIAAIKLINLWEHLLPLTAFTAIMLKNGAVPRECEPCYPLDHPEKELAGKPIRAHKVPCLSKMVEVRKMRTDLTHLELSSLAYGWLKTDDPSLFTVEQITETKVFEEATFFDRFIKSFPCYSQQMIAAWAISVVKRIGLFLDMRTGKTAAASAAAKWAITHDQSADVLLIVCPVGNMYDPWAPWLVDEGWDVRILDGTLNDDAVLIHDLTDHGVHGNGARRVVPVAYIINYERLGSRLPHMQEAWEMERVFVCADETSAIKNYESKRARAMHELCVRPEYVVLLNGTPMEQGPNDLWSQMHCLDNYGVIWDRTFGGFAYHWLVQYAPGKWAVDSDKIMAFEMLITRCSIRYIRAEADQFSGKDKTFRHVALRPTRQMYDQTVNIANGALETISKFGDKIEEEMTQMIIRTYGFMREVACGYDKYREEEEGPYARVRHDIDPKLLWIKCFMAANPTQPCVIYVEFNEQEQRLKEMLNEMKIKWSSTRPEMRKEYQHVLVKKIPVPIWMAIVRKFKDHKEEFISPEIRMDTDCLPVFWYPGIEDDDEIDWDGLPVITASVSTMQNSMLAQNIRATLVFPGHDDVFPSWLIRSHPEVVQYVRSGAAFRDSGAPTQPSWMMPVYTEQFETYVDLGPYPPSQRAGQVRDFNEGRTNVYILKWAQGRGIRLNREEAVKKNIGVYPVIISCAPCWSLGSWKQGGDRCVAVDKRTGKNVNTIIYSLSIIGTLEQHILEALRRKEDVAASLMQDIKRDGFESFVKDMLSDMKDALEGKDKGGNGSSTDSEYFDSEEMDARIELGIPPYSKLTKTLIINKIKQNEKLSKMVKNKFGKITSETIEKFFAGNSNEPIIDIVGIGAPPISNATKLSRAWDLLISKTTE
jgi:hypothetical protein